jgi:hypothetical protein
MWLKPYTLALYLNRLLMQTENYINKINIDLCIPVHFSERIPYSTNKHKGFNPIILNNKPNSKKLLKFQLL